jgi:hypothetical protein
MKTLCESAEASSSNDESKMSNSDVGVAVGSAGSARCLDGMPAGDPPSKPHPAQQLAHRRRFESAPSSEEQLELPFS